MDGIERMYLYIKDKLSNFITERKLEKIFAYEDWGEIILCYGDEKYYFYIVYSIGFSYFFGDMPYLTCGYGKRKNLHEEALDHNMPCIILLEEGLSFQENYNIDFNFEKDLPIVEKALSEIPQNFNRLNNNSTILFPVNEK